MQFSFIMYYFCVFSQSKIMRDTFLVVCVLLFVVLILWYPFKVKIAVHLNVFDAIGFVSIRSLCFKLFSAKIQINENGRLELLQAKKKQQKKRKPFSLLSVYFMTLAKRLSVKKFEWYFTYGSNKNADIVALICGYVLAFDSIVSGVLLNRYNHVKIYNDIDPIFDDNRFEVSTSVVVSFCLFDMFVSVFIAYVNFFKLKLRKRI